MYKKSISQSEDSLSLLQSWKKFTVVGLEGVTGAFISKDQLFISFCSAPSALAIILLLWLRLSS